MKKKNILYLLILSTLILLGACVKDIDVFTGNILGKVTDAKTGEPLKGVSIAITPTGSTKTTGSDGVFEFLDLEPKQYEIRASKEGYNSNSKTVTVITGHDSSGDIQLTPIVEEGVLALNTSTLDFGSNNSSMSFSIHNNGNKSINWSISEMKDVDWLSVSPSSGTIQAGKSNAVVVTLNRKLISEHKETTIIINADKESLPLKITAEAEKKSSKIELSTKSLNFGSEYNTLSFDIKNIGNAGSISWNITGIDADWVKVDPTSGTTAMDKSSAVKVQVDRSKLEAGEHNTNIFVNADGESVSLRITAHGESKMSKIELSADSLDFGTEKTILTFDIKNTGNTGNAEWEITGIDEEWIKVDPTSGTTAMGKCSAVKVQVDRSKLDTGKHAATILVNADGESLPLRIFTEKTETYHKVELSSDALDFGTKDNVLNFEIKNTGNAGNANWKIEGITVDWVKVNPLSGTTAMGKSSTIKVEIDRNSLEYGTHHTTFTVATGNETFNITVYAEKVDDRYLVISPDALDLGTEDSKDFLVYSYNGSTTYNLEVRGNADWAQINPTEGVLPQYVPGDTRSYGKFTVEANRSGVAPGVYSFTLVIKTEMGDYELPISMTVEETPVVGDEEIISCNDNLVFSLTSCTMSGTTATLSYTVENIGNTPVTLSLYGSAGGRSYIYDDQGNQYDFGYNEASLTLGTASDHGSVSATIPAGVKIKGSVKIYNVSDYASKFSNITIWSYSEQNYLIFKNVAIQGRTYHSLEEPQTTGSVVSCHEDLEFTLTSCKISGTTATVSYMVENTGNTPITLSLYGSAGGRSYIYDDQGNQYDFGYNQASLTLGTASDHGNVTTTIPGGVKVKGTVKIYDVDDYASKFSNITIWSYGSQSYLTFKNVAIQGRSYHNIEEPQTTGSVISCSDDLEFTLLDCKRGSSNTVTITYRVTNVTNKAVYLSLYGSAGGRSYIYDDQGNQYDFGYNKASLTLGTASDYSNISTTIPGNVFTKGSVVVKNVDESATELTNVTIWSYSHQANLVFKNVKIRK